MLPRRFALVGALAPGVGVGVGVGAVGHLLTPNHTGNRSPSISQRRQGPTASPRVFYEDGNRVSSARVDGRSCGPASTPLYPAAANDSAWPSRNRHWLLLTDGEMVDMTSDRPIQTVPPWARRRSGSEASDGSLVEMTTSEPWAKDCSSGVVVRLGGHLSSVELATGASVTIGTGQLPVTPPATAPSTSTGPASSSVSGSFEDRVVARIERVSAEHRTRPWLLARNCWRRSVAPPARRSWRVSRPFPSREATGGGGVRARPCPTNERRRCAEPSRRRPGRCPHTVLLRPYLAHLVTHREPPRLRNPIADHPAAASRSQTSRTAIVAAGL